MTLPRFFGAGLVLALSLVSLTACAPSHDAGEKLVLDFLTAIGEGDVDKANALAGPGPTAGGILADAEEYISNIKVGNDADPSYEGLFESRGVVPATYELAGSEYFIEFPLDVVDEDTVSMGDIPFGTIEGDVGVFSLDRSTLVRR